jgi:anti-sigma B factor antagonist
MSFFNGMVVMRIDAENKDDGAILRLSGKVIGDSVPQLRETIEERINSGAKWLIIDLAEVPLMDSSALGTIIAGFLNLRGKNGKLVLLNAQKNILDVLAITKLDSLFEVYDDMQVALESIGSLSP